MVVGVEGVWLVDGADGGWMEVRWWADHGWMVGECWVDLGCTSPSWWVDGRCMGWMVGGCLMVDGLCVMVW